jgi:hypothetical protein
VNALGHVTQIGRGTQRIGGEQQRSQLHPGTLQSGRLAGGKGEALAVDPAVEAALMVPQQCL